MVDIQHSGTTLAIAVIVPGLIPLAIFILRIWFRVTRRKYDISDALLTAAVVGTFFSVDLSHCLLLNKLCAIIQSITWLVMVFAFDHGKLKANTPHSILVSKWPPKLLYFNQIVFKLTTPLCKLSLCYLYHTICATSTGRLVGRTRIAIWCTAVFIVGVYVSALFVSIFQCTPIQKIWKPKIAGFCIEITYFRYSTAVFNIVTSIAVITLPIPVLLQLKHQRPEVKQLIGLVLLGLIHTSLTIARFAVMFFPDPWIKSEPQYGWVPAQTLAVCEMQANILFASLVVMRPAFQAAYHGLIRSRNGSEKSRDSSRSDVAIDSAIGRFRDAWERRKRQINSETDILEASVLSRVDTDVDLEGKHSISRKVSTVSAEYAVAQ
jgi:hypothetical protein